jgi:CO/xanthine dehydrogenase Mo-binding subunit
VIEAEYEVPYLAHACMEPMNCTAHVTADRCEIWAPTQGQHRSLNLAMRLTGLPQEKISIHTTLLGGGFGRRSETDYVEQAIRASMALKRPVKVIWSREEDMRNDYYRPAFFARMQAGLDADGKLRAWRHLDVGPSIFMPAGRPSVITSTAEDFPRVLGVKKRTEETGVDFYALGGALDTPYEAPHTRVEYVIEKFPIPVGIWRSVPSSQNAFFVESFIDEAAHAAGADPYQFRRGLLQKHQRHRAVLDLVAEKAGWETTLPAGRYRGISLHSSFGAVVGQVVELSMVDKRIRLHRLVIAMDCGTVVNPDQVAAQMEGGLVYGLTAAMWGEITMDKGRIVQSNFHDYPMLRLAQLPAVETYFVETSEPPAGVGEPSVPQIAPALTNAIFAASGERARSLPLTRLGYSLV